MTSVRCVSNAASWVLALIAVLVIALELTLVSGAVRLMTLGIG